MSKLIIRRLCMSQATINGHCFKTIIVLRLYMIPCLKKLTRAVLLPKWWQKLQGTVRKGATPFTKNRRSPWQPIKVSTKLPTVLRLNRLFHEALWFFSLPPMTILFNMVRLSRPKAFDTTLGCAYSSDA